MLGYALHRITTDNRRFSMRAWAGEYCSQARCVHAGMLAPRSRALLTPPLLVPTRFRPCAVPQPLPLPLLLPPLAPCPRRTAGSAGSRPGPRVPRRNRRSRAAAPSATQTRSGWLQMCGPTACDKCACGKWTWMGQAGVQRTEEGWRSVHGHANGSAECMRGIQQRHVVPGNAGYQYRVCRVRTSALGGGPL